jgi:uncharacterized protein (DUF58 family)
VSDPAPIPPANAPSGLPAGGGSGAGTGHGTTRPPEADASLYLHPQTLARLGSLELRAKMIVEGVMSGAHRSPYQGFSVEFDQHRPYVPGDDLRHLDWKVFGRTDKLHLKQYQQETQLDLILMVDASGSMAYGSRSFQDASGTGRSAGPHGHAHWTKFDHATACAAALAYVALRQGDRVGMVIYADEIRAQVKRTGQMSAWRQFVGALSTHPIDRPTDLGRAIDQTLAKVTNRCVLVILSDLFEDLERLRAALARIKHRGHDAILCQVLDDAERRFDLRDEAPFEGLEGEALLRVDPRAIRQAYLEAFNRHIEGVQKMARSLGMDYLALNTHDWLGPPLSAFLAYRNARVKRSKLG